MKKWLWILIMIVGVLSAGAGVLALGAPRLDSAYVEKVVERARARYHIPAAAVYVMDSEAVRYSVVEGVRTEGIADRVTADDYFHLGSCAKSVLSYMAAHMVEEGAIGWDTLFFDMYPELAGEALDAYLGITLGDLLACRGGIQPYTSGTEVYPDTRGAEDDQTAFIRHLVGQPPVADQDESGAFSFEYSNAGYTLACAMLERAAEKSYGELMDRYVKDDMGLDVVIGWPYEIGDGQPWGHYLHGDGTLEPLGPGAGYAINPLIAPSGDMSMKPGDFAEYVRLHLRGLRGTGAGLPQETFAYMDRGYEGFSLGAWNERILGKDCVYFDGSAGTFYARGLIMPGEDFGFSLMINNGSEQAADYISMALAKARFRWWWMFWV